MSNGNDTKPEVLTIELLLKDLEKYDPKAIVAMSIIGVPMSIPVAAIGYAEGEKNYLLLGVNYQSVQNAWDYNNEMENEKANVN